MDKEEILSKMQDSKARFEDLKLQVEQAEHELLRLQGEYRALQSLLPKDPPQDK